MELTVLDDLSLSKIMDSGQCFRIRRSEDGTYRFITGTHILYIRELTPGHFDADCSPEQWEQVWAPYFDLGRSYSALREAIPASDSFMRCAAEEGAGIRILRQAPWETLVAFIISQRKSIPAIQSAVERLAERYGEPIATRRGTVFAFPTPDRLAEADLDALSDCALGYRAPYVLDAIRKAASGALDLDALSLCPDAELLEKLREVRGVGNKVASCVALFAYGRTALAPVDTWIGKVIRDGYGGRNPFPAYGDAAGILQQYAFYHALKHKSLFKAGGTDTAAPVPSGIPGAGPPDPAIESDIRKGDAG